MSGYKKIGDLPEGYEVPVMTFRCKNATPVMIDSPQGTRVGWEHADGTIDPGSVIKWSDEYEEKNKKMADAFEKTVNKKRERRVTLAEIREKRDSGEDMTTQDLNSLADLLLGTL